MTFVKWLSRVNRALSDKSHGLHNSVDDLDVNYKRLKHMWLYTADPEYVAQTLLLDSKQKRPEEH